METKAKAAAFEEVKWNISHLKQWGCKMITFKDRVAEWTSYLDREIIKIINEFNLQDNAEIKELINDTYDSLMKAGKNDLAKLFAKKFNI